MTTPKIDTSKYRDLANVYVFQDAARNALNEAADEIDCLTSALDQEQRDHAATKAELKRVGALFIEALGEFADEGMYGTADHYRKALEGGNQQC